MRKLIFTLVAAAILIGGLFLYFKPVFSINGQIIFRPEFEANLSAAAQSEKVFEEKNPGLPSGADLELATAQRILETHLVHAELWKEIDSKTLTPLLQGKIDSALSNQNFMAAAESLYGLSAAGVKNYVVVPQAEEDILKSNLLLQGKNIGDWLLAAKKSASIKIYWSDLKWGGSGFTK